MFAQLFKRIGKPQSKMIQTTSKASNIVKNQSQLSKQLQKEKHKQRRQLRGLSSNCTETYAKAVSFAGYGF